MLQKSSGLINNLEEMRFGLTPVIAILQTELAGVAMYYIYQVDVFFVPYLIILTAFSVSISNALLIACVPMKKILVSFLISLFFSSLSIFLSVI